MPRKLPTRPKRKFEHQIYSFYEGYQERVYFNHLKDLINTQPDNIIKKKISIISKNCGGGDPRTSVKTAIRDCNQNKTPFVFFDYDNKKSEFEEALD